MLLWFYVLTWGFGHEICYGNHRKVRSIHAYEHVQNHVSRNFYDE